MNKSLSRRRRLFQENETDPEILDQEQISLNETKPESPINLHDLSKPRLADICCNWQATPSTSPYEKDKTEPTKIEHTARHNSTKPLSHHETNTNMPAFNMSAIAASDDEVESDSDISHESGQNFLDGSDPINLQDLANDFQNPKSQPSQATPQKNLEDVNRPKHLFFEQNQNTPGGMSTQISHEDLEIDPKLAGKTEPQFGDFSPIRESQHTLNSTCNKSINDENMQAKHRSFERKCSLGNGSADDLENMLNISIDISPIKKITSKTPLRTSQVKNNTSFPSSQPDAKSESSDSPFETDTVDLSTMDDQVLENSLNKSNTSFKNLSARKLFTSSGCKSQNSSFVGPKLLETYRSPSVLAGKIQSSVSTSTTNNDSGRGDSANSAAFQTQNSTTNSVSASGSHRSLRPEHSRAEEIKRDSCPANHPSSTRRGSRTSFSGVYPPKNLNNFYMNTSIANSISHFIDSSQDQWYDAKSQNSSMRLDQGDLDRNSPTVGIEITGNLNIDE